MLIVGILPPKRLASGAEVEVSLTWELRVLSKELHTQFSARRALVDRLIQRQAVVPVCASLQVLLSHEDCQSQSRLAHDFTLQLRIVHRCGTEFDTVVYRRANTSIRGGVVPSVRRRARSLMKLAGSLYLMPQ